MKPRNFKRLPNKGIENDAEKHRVSSPRYEIRQAYSACLFFLFPQIRSCNLLDLNLYYIKT